MAETPQTVPPAQPAWLSLVDGEMCINHAHPVIAALMDVLTIDGDYEYGLDVLGRWQAALGVTAGQTKTDEHSHGWHRPGLQPPPLPHRDDCPVCIDYAVGAAKLHGVAPFNAGAQGGQDGDA
jgi:hypothetical protein